MANGDPNSERLTTGEHEYAKILCVEYSNIRGPKGLADLVQLTHKLINEVTFLQSELAIQGGLNSNLKTELTKRVLNEIELQKRVSEHLKWMDRHSQGALVEAARETEKLNNAG